MVNAPSPHYSLLKNLNQIGFIRVITSSCVLLTIPLGKANMTHIYCALLTNILCSPLYDNAAHRQRCKCPTGQGKAKQLTMLIQRRQHLPYLKS